MSDGPDPNPKDAAAMAGDLRTFMELDIQDLMERADAVSKSLTRIIQTDDKWRQMATSGNKSQEDRDMKDLIVAIGFADEVYARLTLLERTWMDRGGRIDSPDGGAS